MPLFRTACRAKARRYIAAVAVSKKEEIVSIRARGLTDLTTLLTVFLLSMSSWTLLAQSTASLQGTVVDQTGAAVPNAKIAVRDHATGVERSTQTDSAGNYLVAALPVGEYSIEIHAEGFQTQVVSDLKLEVATTVVQDFRLKVGAVTQEVTVTAVAPVVERTTMAVGQVINRQTVQEMPLNGRHFVDLGLLLPGSVVAPQNGFLTAPLRGQGSFAFNTAGNREDTVNFMINGINLNDMVQNQITFQPSINTVAEFKATNSTFSAEYGRNSGAIVNIATRSGTNEFHGEAFEFLRNQKLDAKNFFDKSDLPIPPFKRNQFGGALGGPILRDRTFFFFSFEGLRQRQRVPFNTVVPTAADRSSVTDPTVQRLLQFIPLANAGTKFQGSGSAPVNIDQWTIDVGHKISNQDSLHGYYAFQRDLRGEPSLQLNNIPDFGDTRQARRQIFTFGETHIFGPRVVNDFRMGFNRIHITFFPNVKLNPTSVGINDGINADLGLPQIDVAGSVNFGGPAGFPQGRADTVYVWSDTLSYLRGKHALKLGTEIRRFQNNNANQDIGSMRFTSIADFLGGRANSFSINAAGTFSGIRTTGFGLFAQDNYKLRANLALELGLRWDVNTTPGEVQDRFVVFDPSTASLVRVGTNGLDQVYKRNSKNFAPRVGFAWDPFKDGKTSVRGGYGLFFDQPVTNTVTGLAGNPPFGVPLNAVATETAPVSVSNPLASAAGAPTSSPNTINHDFRNDYVQEWNLNVQREVIKDLGVQIGYFGSKGTHLRMSRNLNQIVNGVRPFKGFSNIFIVDSPGNSSYNALWISATKRMSRGLQFTASYAWSHSIDYNSLNSQGGLGGVSAQDSNNLFNERGSSDFDARHHFNISYLYNFPFKGNRLFEGWEVAGSTTFQSGNPVNLVLPDSTKTGLANTRRSNLIGDPNVPNRDPALWFNKSAFCVPGTVGCGTSFFGNLGRNVIIGPGFKNFDFSVIKNTKITERLRLQFRTEFFNIFNHPNFGQPGRFVGSPTFGQILNTRSQPGDSGSARQIQFALKFIF